MKLIDLNYQYEMTKEEMEKKVLDIVRSGNYIGGTEVAALEDNMRKYLNVKHAISVANGTDALIIALQSLGIGPGDEVITTPFTYYATAESIHRVGAKAVFADVEEDTFNLDPEKWEEKITPATKAVIPVHIFGNPCDMDTINRIAKKHELYVIEDACQAIGSEYKGKKTGGLSDVGCISFFPTKNLGGMGDGGMIVTNDDRVATIAIALKNHGSGLEGKAAYELMRENKDDYTIIPGFEKYYNYMIGYNSRLDAIQAGILNVKLPYLDQWNELRRKAADYYLKQLDGRFRCQGHKPDVVPIYHLFTLRAENRNEVLEKLKEEDISTGVYYPVPLHLQKVFSGLGYQKGQLPVSEKICDEVFSLPMYPGMIQEDQDKVIEVLTKWF